MIRNARHPEKRPDEVFITNVSSNEWDEGFFNIGWKTKRRGCIAYDINGNIIDGMCPIFVKKTEIAKKSMKTLKDLESREKQKLKLKV